MLTYKQYLLEKYYDTIKNPYPPHRIVEIFLNPSMKEIKEIISHDVLRGFILDENQVLLFNINALHGVVREKIVIPKDAISITLTIDGGESFVVVTDNTKHTKWLHNPKIKEYILSNTYLQSLNVDDDIGYFDEAIEGKWEDLEE